MATSHFCSSYTCTATGVSSMSKREVLNNLLQRKQWQPGWQWLPESTESTLTQTTSRTFSPTIHLVKIRFVRCLHDRARYHHWVGQLVGGRRPERSCSSSVPPTRDVETNRGEVFQQVFHTMMVSSELFTFSTKTTSQPCPRKIRQFQADPKPLKLSCINYPSDH